MLNQIFSLFLFACDNFKTVHFTNTKNKRVAKGFCVTRNGPKISSVMRDGAKITRVKRDWTSQCDALFSVLSLSAGCRRNSPAEKVAIAG